MASIIELLYECFSRHGLEAEYHIAFSGGLDSLVLLDACVQLRKKWPLKLTAVHINHGLSQNADAWQAQCHAICDQYHVRVISEAISLSHTNVEAAARTARYAILSRILPQSGILLTAHHADDQAETVLLQLCRGAGTHGLAAMPAIKPMAKGWHARPLLSCTRAQLRAYAQRRNLVWLTDESNQNKRFVRNFIRHDIVPILQRRWPNVVATLQRSAIHCAEDALVLQEYLFTELESLTGSNRETLSVRKLKTYNNIKQRQLLRAWLQQQTIQVPNSKKLGSMVAMLSAHWDSQPHVIWHDYVMRRYRDDLYVHRRQKLTNQIERQWDLREPLVIESLGQLQSQQVLGRGLDPAIDCVSVRFRQGGEVIALGKRGRKTLKNLFQEWHVLPWQRGCIPLLFLQEKLIAIVGHAIDPDYQVQKPNMVGLEIALVKHNEV